MEEAEFIGLRCCLGAFPTLGLVEASVLYVRVGPGLAAPEDKISPGCGGNFRVPLGFNNKDTETPVITSTSQLALLLGDASASQPDAKASPATEIHCGLSGSLGAASQPC